MYKICIQVSEIAKSKHLLRSQINTETKTLNKSIKIESLLYTECQKKLDKEKNKKEKLLNLILAFEMDIKKMEIELNIYDGNDDGGLINDDVFGDNVSENMHENVFENVHENILENTHENTYENVHENKSENMHENESEVMHEEKGERKTDTEVEKFRNMIDNIQNIDIIPSPTSSPEKA